MAQDIQRLVTEVNKLIINELITAGGIYLPQIGSLSVESDDSAEARRRVAFSTAEHYTSLVTVIAMQTKCSVDQASMLYNKWSEAVHKNLQVEIEGIGVVRGGRFEASPIIEKRLNPVVIKSVATPKPAKPKATKSVESSQEVRDGRSRWGVWIVAVAAVIAVAVAIPKLLDSQEVEETEVAQVEKIEEVAPTIAESQKEIKIEEVKTEEPKTVVEAEQPTKTLLSTRKAKTTSNAEAAELLEKTLAASNSRPATKYKVVYGVYRSKANAGRALVDAQVLNSDIRTVYGATLREGNYMVTLFESDHFYTSVSYMKRNNPEMNNMLWVYDPQKM